MYCPKCGTNNQPDMKYCYGCGAPITNPASQPRTGLREASFADVMKKQAGSPLVLAAMICYSVMVLCSLLSALTSYSTLGWLGTVSDYLYDAGLDLYSFNVFSLVRNTSLVFSVIGQAPSIAICVGLWLFYASAKGKSSLKATGLLVIKIVILIQGGFLCAGILVSLVGLLILASATRGAYGAGFIIGVAFGILLISAAYVFYYIKLVVMLSGMQQMVITKRKNNNATRVIAVIVYLILFAIGAFFSAFTSSGLGIIALLTKCAALILFIVVLFRYRSWILVARETDAGGSRGAYNVGPEPVPPFQSGANQWNNGRGYASNYEDPGTVVLSNGGGQSPETTLLSHSGPAPSFAIQRDSTGEKKYIRGVEFRLGKNEGVNDFVITGNAAISRTHAVIRLRNGSLTIEDLNSSNHVYVNGAQISAGIATPISAGDSIYLANEGFTILG